MNPSPFAKRQIILLAVLFCSIAFLLAIADRAPIHMENGTLYTFRPRESRTL